MLPSIDLQSIYLSDSEDTPIKWTSSDQPMSGLPAMVPIRFNEDGGGGGDQQIRQELEELPGYHRNVTNCSSSVSPSV